MNSIALPSVDPSFVLLGRDLNLKESKRRSWSRRKEEPYPIHGRNATHLFSHILNLSQGEKRYIFLAFTVNRIEAGMRFIFIEKPWSWWREVKLEIIVKSFLRRSRGANSQLILFRRLLHTYLFP